MMVKNLQMLIFIEVLELIHEHKANTLLVSRKLIMRKAKDIHKEASDGDLYMLGGVITSPRWLEKSMKRNGPSQNQFL